MKKPIQVPADFIIKESLALDPNPISPYRREIRGVILDATSLIEERIEVSLLKLLGISTGKSKVIKEMLFARRIDLLKDLGTGVDMWALNDLRDLRNEFAHGTTFNTFAEYYSKNSAARERIMHLVGDLMRTSDRKITGTTEETLYVGVLMLFGTANLQCSSIFEVLDERTKATLTGKAAVSLVNKLNTIMPLPFNKVLRTISKNNRRYNVAEIAQFFHAVHEDLHKRVTKLMQQEMRAEAERFNQGEEAFLKPGYKTRIVIKPLRSKP